MKKNRVYRKKTGMEFRRWGTLAPQKHMPDGSSFHCAPMEYGFYAFPKGVVEKFLLGGSYGNVLNGRYGYVRDAKGEKVMMTLDDFGDIYYKTVPCDYDKDLSIRKAAALGDIVRDEDGIILWAPDKWKAIVGLNYYDLSLCRGQGTIVFRCVKEEDDNDFDPQKLYPLVKENKKPTKFEYKGDIWHHLEWTDPDTYYWKHYWGMEDDGKHKRLVRPEDVIRRSGSWILTDMKTYEKALTQAVNIYKYRAFMMQKREGDVQIDGRPGGVPNENYSWDDFEVFIEKL